ncbi:putative dehydrogenase tr07 [Coniosporium apollinis]|uniref:Dehydrogenase tr07 n=1 Tax=Coniosporium apollinis TaxID=61459 RepID=A0ABQ9P118_9PEZI|nr:putative dehydrogenase tr07 [Coniosporium apollinis]
MKIAVFSAQPYDRQFLDEANEQLFSSKGSNETSFELIYHNSPLSLETAPLAAGASAVCAFVNDQLDAATLSSLHANGTRAILLRCAGFNNVDLGAAERLNLFVANVPAYSPEAVAEYAVALLLTLNRRTHRAFNRVREGNFNLNGLMGFTVHGKTVGIVGTGKIGLATARILKGFGCRLLAYDPFTVPAFKELGEYVDLDTLLSESDVVSLHCPLMESTRNLINSTTLAKIKQGAILVNTSRGGLIDTPAVITALKERRLGGLALDVYDQESSLFYLDRSSEIIHDDYFSRLMTFPNVIMTGHQGFFTVEALREISEVTLRNMEAFATGTPCKNDLVGGKGVLSPRP